jgi:hypothetical protein
LGKKELFVSYLMSAWLVHFITLYPDRTICHFLLQYIDYDRDLMSGFLNGDEQASSMVVGFGHVIQTMYNLKGELVCATRALTVKYVGISDTSVQHRFF